LSETVQLLSIKAYCTRLFAADQPLKRLSFCRLHGADFVNTAGEKKQKKGIRADFLCEC
jgi:hypothetical protein